MNKPKRGRPPAPPDEKLILRTIRLKASHWEKIAARGGIRWLRELIERAKG